MRFETPDGPREFAISDLIVAGWTGRDAAAVQHHIDELAALGVAPPSQVPLFYRVSASLMSQSGTIQVLGPDTSGEAEPFLVRADGRMWLGLASDHTDRALEAVSVAASKQVCAKPVASMLWPMDEVEHHLDRLRLRCMIFEGDAWVPYQDGPLEAIRPLADLARMAALSAGQAMLCGTLSAIGGVRPGIRYRMSLEDPVSGRSIGLEYDVTCLPVIA